MIRHNPNWRMATNFWRRLDKVKSQKWCVRKWYVRSLEQSNVLGELHSSARGTLSFRGQCSPQEDRPQFGQQRPSRHLRNLNVDLFVSGQLYVL